MKIDRLLQEWSDSFEDEIELNYAHEEVQYNIEMLSELIEAINEFDMLVKNT